jgi:chemotaxis protein methyltransferase CheR
MDDASFRKILLFFGLSWQGYRKVRKGVKKRIARHMEALGCRTVDDLLVLFRENPQELGKARELLTVTISRFFRDRQLWDILGKHILPQMCANREGSCRVWHAGCASGEEVYSFKIVWDQASRAVDRSPPLEIWATDLNPLVLRRCQDAIYPSRSLKELDAQLRDAYFVPVPQGFAVRREFCRGIYWMHHDFVLEEPPRTCFDLIFLRNNLLTYYGPEEARPVLAKIVGALNKGGYLIIGSHERVMSPDLALEYCEEDPRILRKSDFGAPE